jgi:TATA-binding protein-associated factor
MTINIYGDIDPADDSKMLIIAQGANDWQLDAIDRVMKIMTPAFERLKEPRFVWKVAKTWACVAQLGSVFQESQGSDEWGHGYKWVPSGELSKWIVDEIMRRASDDKPVGEDPARSPMSHQSAGAVAIGMNGTFLLADEMGTGKTQTVLMGLAELEKRDRNPFPAIVVCPAAVIDPWLEDITEVYPQWRPFCTDYRGPNRRKWLDKNPDIKILVMSYETMRNDIGDSGKEGPLMKWAVKNANTVIYDEAHKLCNHDTKQSTRARRLAKKVSNVVMATGTPITKGTANFWPLLNGMEPGAFPNRERFKVRYTTDKRQEQYGDGQGLGGLDPLTEPEFRTVMQGTMRRVATADVLDLPEKTYQRRLIDIPAKWRAVYEEMEEDMIAHLPSEDEETALTAMTTLVKMMRLAQLANSACDLETVQELDDKPGSDTYGEMVEKIMVHPKEPCWKGDAMLEILAELHQDDRGSGIEHGHNPVVAFAPHKKLTRLCGKMAEAKGYRVGYIDGDVSGTQRTKYRLAFQDNELDLMMVSTGAGGTGLTLTAASTAIYLMRPWSYVESTQSEARIYRKGQTRHTQIIDLIARNSVESRVLESLRAKNANLAELVRDRRLVESFLGGGR